MPVFIVYARRIGRPSTTRKQRKTRRQRQRQRQRRGMEVEKDRFGADDFTRGMINQYIHG